MFTYVALQQQEELATTKQTANQFDLDKDEHQEPGKGFIPLNTAADTQSAIMPI